MQKTRDTGSILGLGRSLGEGNGYPLQYSCLEIPMDRRAWPATVPGVTKESDITQRLNNNNKSEVYDLWKVLVAQSCPTFATPWTVACQAPLSMGFSRQEYLSGFPFPSPGDLPDPRIKPEAPTSQADSLLTELRRIKSWQKQIRIPKLASFTG